MPNILVITVSKSEMNETEKIFEEMLAEKLPILIKTHTEQPRSMANLKQDKYRENYIYYFSEAAGY